MTVRGRHPTSLQKKKERVPYPRLLDGPGSTPGGLQKTKKKEKGTILSVLCLFLVSMKARERD